MFCARLTHTPTKQGYVYLDSREIAFNELPEAPREIRPKSPYKMLATGLLRTFCSVSDPEARLLVTSSASMPVREPHKATATKTLRAQPSESK